LIALSARKKDNFKKRPLPETGKAFYLRNNRNLRLKIPRLAFI
jgi:hypothetical protein